ncbi:MAG: hypothetical protein HON43_06920 [Alphaproteobacteria bacterium]|nr:hypothetical protein [Alphaproteobacteria bacterium]MBT5389762.1 hypothetical protein [Alphaproteobacteria bacterium]MBT5540856.1 hypothetical protein [Alphaproteobacteria bacterium]
MLTDSQKEFFHNKGYIHLKNVFTKQEVEWLRECSEKHDGGDVLSDKAFKGIIFDKRIIEPLKNLIGAPLIYFGESGARYDNIAKPRGSRTMHNDSKNDDFDFTREYSVYRIGLYLQDCDEYSGGLKLRPASHRSLCISKHGLMGIAQYLKSHKTFKGLIPPKSINVPSKAGDLLIWSMRIHHSGHAIRLKGFPNISLPTCFEDFVPNLFKRPVCRKRSVIFASFGTDSDYLEDYIEDRVKHSSMVDHWKKCDFDQKFISNINYVGKEVFIRKDGVKLKNG